MSNAKSVIEGALVTNCYLVSDRDGTMHATKLTDAILAALKDAGISLVEWRPMTERPDTEMQVLFMYPKSSTALRSDPPFSVASGFWHKHKTHGWVIRHQFDTDPDVSAMPTHWAPLPAPPKGEVK